MSASVAHAKPKGKAKGSFGCKLTEVQMVEAPTYDEIEIIVAVRLTCTNGTAKKVRIKRNDITLVTSEGYQYDVEKNPDNFSVIFADQKPMPEFIDRFSDIAPGETVELGFTFTGGAHLTDPDVTIDVDGTEYEYHRPEKD